MRSLVCCVLLALAVVNVSGLFNWIKISEKLKLKQVSTGPSGVWGVTAADQVYYRPGTCGINKNTRGTKWVRVRGAMTQIDSGYNSVWAVNKHNQIYMKRVDCSSPGAGGWTLISGTFKHVSVGGSNRVWGVTQQGDIYRRLGVTKHNPKGTSWKHIPGKLKMVCAGGSGVWGVNNANRIYLRKGTYNNQNIDGTGWELVPGSLKYISCGDIGIVWGVNSNDNVYYRHGISPRVPKGKLWVPETGRLSNVAVYDGANGIWGVNNRGTVFMRSAQLFAWREKMRLMKIIIAKRAAKRFS